jgi:MFS family permease
VAAAPALLLIPALLMLDEPKRGASEGIHDVAPTGSMWSVLRIPTLWWIIASGALVNFNMYAIGTFMPAMFGRIFRLDVGRAGVITGVVYMAGGIAGGLFGGWIGDWIIIRHKNGRLWMGAILSLAGAPFAYFGAAAGDLNSAIVFWTIAYASLNTYYGLVYSSIQDIVAPAQRGATMALYFMAMYLCGASFGSLITGGLSDHYARLAAQAAGSNVLTEAARASGLQQAMLVIAVVNIGLAFVLWMGSRTILNDIARRQATAAAAAAA